MQAASTSSALAAKLETSSSMSAGVATSSWHSLKTRAESSTPHAVLRIPLAITQPGQGADISHPKAAPAAWLAQAPTINIAADARGFRSPPGATTLQCVSVLGAHHLTRFSRHRAAPLSRKLLVREPPGTVRSLHPDRLGSCELLVRRWMN